MSKAKETKWNYINLFMMIETWNANQLAHKYILMLSQNMYKCTHANITWKHNRKNGILNNFVNL